MQKYKISKTAQITSMILESNKIEIDEENTHYHQVSGIEKLNLIGN